MSSSAETVKAWAETITIPTYPIGQLDKNPMFLEKRVYQGSSGVVYPYPVIDRVCDEKTDQAYTAVFLENRYLKIMILPEIGGRVQMALDKTNGYHFIYYNRVIKPALVGLAGPWISGGIEFNWPQHHRPSTFEPLDWRIVEHADGSRTVWCSEIERMFFTKGMHGFRLYPDRAYLEISVQLYNRTSEPQTFLWWANPAVHVNDDYQSVFPPDVHAVMDHGKRDVSDFPIATGTYYKVNYAPGTDISRHKNIPVPTSYMAYHSDFDFVGDYDHGQQAGMIHVANHHVVPGKKQWTWGNSDFGRAWDRQLTDDDGPYIELMCGAFTDNQPDFSWIMPGEEKRFTQIFMPYKQIGPAKNANRDAVLNLEVADDLATVGAYLTQPREAHVELQHNGEMLWQTSATLGPERALIETVALPPQTQPQHLTLRIADARSGRELLTFTPLPDERAPIPAPTTAAKPPREIASNEELFLNGLHLEQYRHATYAPEPYYEEVLRRDPYDSRCNNALGLLLYRRGKFAEAEAYFRKAIERLTGRNPNPYDGEPYYNLGLALKMQGRYPAAFDAFYKAVWNAAWQDSAYFELARLAARLGDDAQALELIDNALRRNWSHHKARHLKIALLRRLGHNDQALEEAARALELDAMDIGVMWEQRLLGGVPPHPPAPSPTRGEGEQDPEDDLPLSPAWEGEQAHTTEQDLPLSPAWERGAGGEGTTADRWDVPESLRAKMVEVAREFRKAQTPSEALLWQALRGKKLDGRKFRRQQPIGPFVVDFFCASERLIVEVDGPVHETQRVADQQRQQLIESLGLRFIRVLDSEVERNLLDVLDMIRARFASPHPPTPSPTRGKGEQKASAVEKRDLPLSRGWERGPGGEGLHVEIALDYLHAGLFNDAIALLDAAPKRDPMTLYFLGECYVQKGDAPRAAEVFWQAAALPADYCFPHRLESVPALQSAMDLNPADARAPYYLGNFWYAHRRYAEAIACWEQACELDPAFPTAFRNLGLAYFNKLHDPARALAAYQRAFELNPDDARVLFELDQLEKKLNHSPQERLARLEQHRDLVERRDDLTIEYITLLNMHGKEEQAYAILLGRQFHPWEGGEGKTTGQYIASLIARAQRLIGAGEYAQAVERLERALVYPHNLGEGKLPNAQENNIYYYLGLAKEATADAAGARACFERAATGLSEPTSAMYYNDQPPDMIFYQGLARRKLGRSDEARQIFQKLVDYGQAHLGDEVEMDYFAVSLPTFLVFDEDLTQRNQTHCYYIMALGHLGLGNSAEAQQCFDRVLALDANHQGAVVHRLFEIHSK